MKLTRRGLFKSTGAIAVGTVLAALPNPGLEALGKQAIVSDNWYRYIQVVGGRGKYAEYVGKDRVLIRLNLPKDLKKLAGILPFAWPPAGYLKTDETVKGFAWMLVRGRLS